MDVRPWTACTLLVLSPCKAPAFCVGAPDEFTNEEHPWPADERNIHEWKSGADRDEGREAGLVIVDVAALEGGGSHLRYDMGRKAQSRGTAVRLGNNHAFTCRGQTPIGTAEEILRACSSFPPNERRPRAMAARTCRAPAQLVAAIDLGAIKI